MEGGLNSWNGLLATGAPEAGMAFFSDKDKLEDINAMGKEELKEFYKNVLNNGQMSEKGGGGLGMIDIARKSGQKLDYGFMPFDDNHSFFSLNVNIN